MFLAVIYKWARPVRWKPAKTLETCGQIPRTVSPHSLRLGVLRKTGASRDGDLWHSDGGAKHTKFAIMVR